MKQATKLITVAACAGIALSLSVVAQARWSAAAKEQDHEHMWQVRTPDGKDGEWVVIDDRQSTLHDGEDSYIWVEGQPLEPGMKAKAGPLVKPGASKMKQPAVIGGTKLDP
jgi:hypothetical protein